jgi:hypothetical protein
VKLMLGVSCDIVHNFVVNFDAICVQRMQRHTLHGASKSVLSDVTAGVTCAELRCFVSELARVDSRATAIKSFLRGVLGLLDSNLVANVRQLSVLSASVGASCVRCVHAFGPAVELAAVRVAFEDGALADGGDGRCVCAGTAAYGSSLADERVAGDICGPSVGTRRARGDDVTERKVGQNTTEELFTQRLLRRGGTSTDSSFSCIADRDPVGWHHRREIGLSQVGGVCIETDTCAVDMVREHRALSSICLRIIRIGCCDRARLVRYNRHVGLAVPVIDLLNSVALNCILCNTRDRSGLWMDRYVAGLVAWGPITILPAELAALNRITYCTFLWSGIVRGLLDSNLVANVRQLSVLSASVGATYVRCVHAFGPAVEMAGIGVAFEDGALADGGDGRCVSAASGGFAIQL